MSEPKFTQGPWMFCNDDKGMYQSTDDGKRLKLLFSFDMSFVGLSASEHNANASLIASSPEMYANEEDNLKILEALRDYLHGMLYNPVYAYMRDDLMAFVRRLSTNISKTKMTLAKVKGEE